MPKHSRGKPMRTRTIKNKRGGCGFCNGGGIMSGGGCGCGGSGSSVDGGSPITGGSGGSGDVMAGLTNIIPYNLNQHAFPVDARNYNLIGGNKGSRIHFSKLKNMALKKRRTSKKHSKKHSKRRTWRKHHIKHGQKGGFSGYPNDVVSSFGGLGMVTQYQGLLTNNVPIVPPSGAPPQYV